MGEVVWDRRSGAVIDASTGIVIDEVVVSERRRYFDEEELRERVYDAPLPRLRFRAIDPVAQQARELGFVHVHPEVPSLEKTALTVYNVALNAVREFGLGVDSDTVERVVRTALRVLTEDGFCSAQSCVSRALLPVVLWALSAIAHYPLCKKLREACRHRGRFGASLAAARVLERLGKRRDPVEAAATWLERICSELGVMRLLPLARWILLRTMEGSPPRLAAAASVYVASLLSGAGVTYADLARVVGAAEATVSKWSNKALSRLGCDVVRSGAAWTVYCPEDVCREAKGLAGLDERVVCTG